MSSPKLSRVTIATLALQTYLKLLRAYITLAYITPFKVLGGILKVATVNHNYYKNLQSYFGCVSIQRHRMLPVSIKRSFRGRVLHLALCLLFPLIWDKFLVSHPMFEASDAVNAPQLGIMLFLMTRSRLYIWGRGTP